jgi:hypothetical protein
MEPQEIVENTEKAHESGERGVGLTMAIFAVMLAIATMMSHRAHTEEVLREAQASDQWNYYQAKNIRSHLYDADAEMAGLFGDRGAQEASDFRAKSAQQKKDSEEIQREAQKLGKEVEVMGRRATFYDGSELFLEVAIVLCSISLLARSRAYWKYSFVFSAIGLMAILWGITAIH